MSSDTHAESSLQTRGGGSSSSSEPLKLPDIILGGGVFGAQYSPSEYLESDIPAQVISKAFDAGMTAIDTSPFYGASESIIGKAISSPSFSARHPRSSFLLLTKCGRYGANSWSFDYSPERIKASVQESCRRFCTEYIDVVYLHDVEFVSESAGKAGGAGFPLEVLEKPEEYGLEAEVEGKILGKGDQAILDAYNALVELKAKGVIRKAGIAGYPLPTLLRLARLIRAHLEPVDVLQTYSTYNLQNRALKAYARLFKQAGVGALTNASPVNMGLLTGNGPQDWHLAPASLRKACKDVHAALVKKGTTLQAVALGFGLSSAKWGAPVPLGCNTPEHVDEVLRIWNTLYVAPDDKAREQQQENERLVLDALKETGYLE